jgi:hypothetical protein
MLLTYKQPFRLVLFLVISLSITSFAQESSDRKTALKGTPILWQEPVDIASRDLYLGAGGEAMKPNLSKITFIKEESGGYSTKYRVRDANGQEWVVKLGKESQPDTVANRLLWAIGYQTEIAYLVPRVTIEGKGTVENARFEARPKNIERDGEWHWDDNPFKGTREFQGLKVMMLLLNNWDIKDANNKILLTQNPQTGQVESHYIISDLGGTLGKTGGIVSRTRNKPVDFFAAQFVEGVKDHYVRFNYGGKRGDLFRDITIEQAGWIGELLSKLSPQQIDDIFRAANYSSDEMAILRQALLARINELVSLQNMRLKSKN